MSVTPSTLDQNRLLRIGVSLFFFVCVPLSIWETNVHSGIFVSQDPAMTANRLLENEFAFRTTLISHMLGTTVFLILVWLFYRVLKAVNPPLAMLMFIPIIIQFAIVFMMESLNYTALMTLKARPRPSFELIQQQEAAYFLLRLYRFTFGADKIIFGLIFIPLGVLFFQSRIVPKAVGVLLALGGVGYLLDTSLYFLLQRENYAAIQSMKLFSSATYSLGFLWILLKGASRQKVTTQSAA